MSRSPDWGLPALTKRARQSRVSALPSPALPSTGSPNNTSPRQHDGSVLPAKRGSDEASAERSRKLRQPDSPSALTTTGLDSLAPSSTLNLLSHSRRSPGLSRASGSPLPRISRKMPRRPGQRSSRQRPSVWAARGVARCPPPTRRSSRSRARRSRLRRRGPRRRTPSAGPSARGRLSRAHRCPSGRTSRRAGGVR